MKESSKNVHFASLYELTAILILHSKGGLLCRWFIVMETDTIVERWWSTMGRRRESMLLRVTEELKQGNYLIRSLMSGRMRLIEK